jgi:hypothetical protein
MSGSPSNPYAPQSQEPPQLPQSSAGSADLTAADWVLCVLCSGIACIIGIIRLIQGKPSGGKMVGIALPSWSSGALCVLASSS